MQYLIPGCRFRCDLSIFPEEEAEAFLLDYDDLLERITAREVRENDLDLDDEIGLRFWFHEARS